MANTNNGKRTKIRFIVACLLFLVLVVSGGSFMYIEAKDNDASNTRNSTGTALTKSPTPTPTLTSQPPFFDDFSDSSKGWYVGSVPGYSRVIANDTLTLADTNHKILPESLPTTTLFSDFTANLTFTIIQASADDSVGLYLRGDSYLDHDYRVDIYGNNTYTIGKEFLDTGKHPQVQYLVGPTMTSSLKPIGQPNTINVMMKNSRLALQVNGTVVNTVTDTDYASGQIALFVQNSDTSNGIAVAFSSVAVYPAL